VVLATPHGLVVYRETMYHFFTFWYVLGDMAGPSSKVSLELGVPGFADLLFREEWAFSGTSYGAWPDSPLSAQFAPSSTQSACTKKGRIASQESNGRFLVHFQVAGYGRARGPSSTQSACTKKMRIAS
jgi:hypothetical protein